jgi:TetR/AcrR family transcriptional regulator
MARPQSSADTREKMLEVAERRFAEKSYDGAHLQSIASEVGVRKTALYYYFSSKEDLYVAVLERILLEFDRTITRALQTDRPTVERLHALSDGINDLLAERPNYSQILIRIFVDRIPITEKERISPTIEKVVGDVLQFHHEGVAEGVFRPSSSRHFFNSVLGMALFHYAGGPISAAICGVEDIFTQSAVSWRRNEFKRVLLPGLLTDPEGQG